MSKRVALILFNLGAFIVCPFYRCRGITLPMSIFSSLEGPSTFYYLEPFVFLKVVNWEGPHSPTLLSWALGCEIKLRVNTETSLTF